MNKTVKYQIIEDNVIGAHPPAGIGTILYLAVGMFLQNNVVLVCCVREDGMYVPSSIYRCI